MVEFFNGQIAIRLLVPNVEGEFTNRVNAAFMEEQFILFEQIGDQANSLIDIIFSRDDVKLTMFADTGDEAGSGGIHNNGGDVMLTDQLEQILIIVLIGFNGELGTGIEVKLFDSEPLTVMLSPKPHRAGIDGTIIAGNDELGAVRASIDDMDLLREHRINKPMRSGPFPQNEAIIESAGVEGFIAFTDMRGKPWIILHREVEVEQIFFFPFENPVGVEPMERIFWITIKPEAAAVDGASSNRLFDEGAIQQNDLIEQNASEGNPLNGSSRRSIITGEEVEAILNALERNIQIIFGTFIGDSEAQIFEGTQNWSDDISPNRSDCFATDSEELVLKVCGSPKEEGDCHREGFPAAHGAAADDAIESRIRGIRVPPGEQAQLFWGEGVTTHRRRHHPDNFSKRPPLVEWRQGSSLIVG